MNANNIGGTNKIARENMSRYKEKRRRLREKKNVSDIYSKSVIKEPIERARNLVRK